jgi:hypothetical protein
MYVLYTGRQDSDNNTAWASLCIASFLVRRLENRWKGTSRLAPWAQNVSKQRAVVFGSKIRACRLLLMAGTTGTDLRLLPPGDFSASCQVTVKLCTAFRALHYSPLRTLLPPTVNPQRPDPAFFNIGLSRPNHEPTSRTALIPRTVKNAASIYKV